jgi:hypothetical protein
MESYTNCRRQSPLVIKTQVLCMIGLFGPIGPHKLCRHDTCHKYETFWKHRGGRKFGCEISTFSRIATKDDIQEFLRDFMFH